MSKQQKVLLVEDNAEELRLETYQLNSAGLQVQGASNAGQVMTILKEECDCPGGRCFDLVILDVDLPDITGTTLGEFIRAKYPELPILFYTGYGRLPHIVDTANRIGAILLEKPIDGDEFAAICKDAINKKLPVVTADKPRKDIVTHILRVMSFATDNQKI